MKQVSESDYRTAQEGDAKVRQEFLDATDLEEAKEFVSGVRYIDMDLSGHIYTTKEKLESVVTMGTACFEIKILGFPLRISKKSSLVVCQNAFKLTLPAFLSILIDHEGQHARQYFQRFLPNYLMDWKMDCAENDEQKTYFRAVRELPACLNELANAKRRGLTQKETRAYPYFAFYLNNLTDFYDSFKKPRNLCKDVESILCNSPGDNLAKRLLNMDGKNESTQEILREIKG